MQIEDLDFLLTPEGQQLLREASEPPIREDNHLQVVSRLREKYKAGLVQAAVETVLLRQRAASKFSHASEMYFTKGALEQASGEVVANYRAAKYARLGLQTLVDLGCGIGGDAVALTADANVIGIDLEPLRLLMARENVDIYGHGSRFLALQGDVRTILAPRIDAFFFDPGRRDKSGKRLKSVTRYQPPLSTVDLWRERIEHGAVKVSPAIDYAEIPAEATVEFVSFAGDVKEGILWYGDLQDNAARRATLLPVGCTLSTEDYPGGRAAVTPPGNYLYEPDGAVIRAHLVQALACRLNGRQIDPEIAYLTSDNYQETPFARCFELEDWFPFQLKRLRHYLRARNVGTLTIKKRGSPLEPESLRRQLRLRGDEERVLFLTHVLGEPAVLIGREVASS